MAEEDAAVKGTQFLGQKIGPMPAGAWLAVIAGGLGIGMLMRRRSSAPQPVPISDADRQLGPGVYGATVPTGTDSAGMPKYGSNQEWIRAAMGNLIGRGFLADKVSNALNRIFYPTDKNPPTPEDSAIYEVAIKAIGAPPTLPTAYVPPAPGGGNVVTREGNLKLTSGFRYLLGAVKSANPEADPEVYVSVGGKWAPSTAATISAGANQPTAFEKGKVYFLQATGQAPSGETHVTAADLGTGASVSGKAYG